MSTHFLKIAIGRLTVRLLIAVSVYLFILVQGGHIVFAKHDNLSPEQMNQVEQFNKTVDELYRFVEQQNWEKAMQSMLLMEKQIMEIPLSGLTHLEGMEALYKTMLDMKRQLSAVSPDSTALMHTAAKLRLASDALVHPHQPMWEQYDQVLHEDVEGMKLGLEQKQYENLRKSYQELKQHYELIRPALSIVHEPHVIEQFNAFMTTLDEAIQKNGINLSQVADVLPPLRAWLEVTFQRETEFTQAETTVQPESMIFSFAIGSVIVAVLAYVGWRKYRYDHGFWG